MAETVRFEHFEVLRREDGALHELGRGAMGITYKAFDTNLRSFVALKVINSAYLNSEVARQRFLREARAAAALRHPNVATVFHLGSEDGSYFYAMEFVDGETVEAIMKRDGPVAARTALEIVRQVSRALGAAQKQDLVHRDIKPSNLMVVREEGGEFTVKVIDFGLAKSARPEATGEDSATLTSAGFLGTPHFASPEQLEERELDTRSDIYSLGVTLWYMLTGRTLFSGSLAQVMSQHLHRVPPFEELEGQSETVVRLLRRMVAKNPAERPQTPGELRREIEATLESLEEAPAGAGPVIAEGDSTVVSGVPAQESDDLVPDAVLGGRYRILKELTASDHGRMFRAERLEDGASVALLALSADLLSSSEAFTRIEQEVDCLQRLDSPAFRKVLSLENAGHVSFLALEDFSGRPSLLDLLRVRRALPGGEAGLLLKPLAAAFDELAGAGLGCPDIGAHEVFLPAGAEPAVPISSWPECLPKFLPLTGSGVASPDATLVASSFAVMKARGAFSEDPSRAFVYAVAALAYEMVGGVRTGSSLGSYVPIPELSEAGNSVLRAALTSGRRFASAQSFVEELTASHGRSPAPVSSTPPPLPPPIRKSRLRALIAAGVAVLFVIATIGLVGVEAVRQFERFRAATRSPEAVGSPGVESVSPTAPPEPEQKEAEMDVAASTPAPAATPASTPTPSAYDLAMTAAEESRLKDDASGALDAYARAARESPEERRPREAMEMLAASLRARSEKLSAEDFAALRQPLEAAASLDVVSAQVLLGEKLRQIEPAGALKWFLAASQNGQTEAMVVAGQMRASGRGVAGPDLPGAAALFARAAELGDASGMFMLSECLLHGKGVSKDPRRAVELLTAASALNSPRAMNLLGDIFRKGIPGVLEPRQTEAFRLFSRAAELGFLDAQGNLGVLYIHGEGVAKDLSTAVRLFREGAEKDNALCMLFFAKCLEGGVGLPANAAEARQWYLRAANAGNRDAIDWCKKHNIPLANSP